MSLIRSLADKMDASNSASDIWASAVSCLHQIGVSKAVFMDLSQGDNPTVLSNASDSWTRRYKHFVRAGQDPFARNCLTTVSSQLTGIGHFERHKHLRQDALDQIAKGSDELHILTGMSITLRPDPKGAGVGLNLMTGRSVCEFAQLRLEQEDVWRAWSQLVYAGLNQANVERTALTNRERDCLAYVADGMRTTEVAHTLGISEGTVELHLRNARSRLHAKTRDQAVAIAVRARMI